MLENLPIGTGLEFRVWLRMLGVDDVSVIGDSLNLIR